MPLRIESTPAGVTFAVKAVPGSSKDRIVGLHGEALKVTVTAPPERGRANERILELLAAALGLPAGAVELVAGRTHAQKQVRVRGLAADEVARRLGAG